MRLLMTADAVGGVWTYALDLARGLALHDIETTLVVLGPSPDAPQVAAAGSVPGLDLVDTGARLDWLAGGEDEVAEAARVVAELARRADADVVQLNSPTLAALARFPASVVGVCHSCVATWWDAVRAEPLPRDFRWRTDLLARGYDSCNALVAPSAAFAAVTRQRYGARPVVVHNGRGDVADLPEPFEVPARYVLTAGRLWDEAKDVATLDGAAALLDVPVLAAGPLRGPHDHARELRHAVALGSLDPVRLRWLMERATVFASPARYEPFGLAVLEAARARCPLVLSDIPTFRELWDGAALFVPARDPAALADALRRVLDDADFAASLADAAWRRSRRYDVATMAAGMHEVFRGVLGSVGRTARAAGMAA